MAPKRKATEHEPLEGKGRQPASHEPHELNELNEPHELNELNELNEPQGPHEAQRSYQPQRPQETLPQRPQETLPPNATLHLSNLPTRHPSTLAALRRQLYLLFTAHGPVLGITLHPRLLRGQAFVVFRDVRAAARAMAALQAYPFFDRSLRIAYARSQSHASLAFERACAF